MKRWMKFLIAVVVILVGALAIADTLLERSARRAATNNGAFRDFHNLTASELEQQIHNGLPIGSSRTAVDNYLSNQGMRFSSSIDEIDALAPYLKGSGIVRNDMVIKFHFNGIGKLQSIDTKIHLTGP
jgi:hypothetical protein